MDYCWRFLIIFFLIFFVSASTILANPVKVFKATAYCGVGPRCPYSGKTASGAQVRRGMVASDPKVLPFGTWIYITEPKKYAGLYLVTDSGSAIIQNKLDIWVPSYPEAINFGKKDVSFLIVGRMDRKFLRSPDFNFEKSRKDFIYTFIRGWKGFGYFK